MHRKADVVAHGVAEDVDPGMLRPNVTVLEHRRCGAARRALLCRSPCGCGMRQWLTNMPC